MTKKGDKLVCINNKDCDLTINKIYTVRQVFIEFPDIFDDSEIVKSTIIKTTYVLLNNDKPEIYGEADFYNLENFITLKEYRKNKLNEINSVQKGL